MSEPLLVKYKRRIAELEGLLKAEQDSNHRLSAKELELEAELKHQQHMADKEYHRYKELEAENAKLRTLLQRWFDDVHANRDFALWDDTESLLEGE